MKAGNSGSSGTARWTQSRQWVPQSRPTDRHNVCSLQLPDRDAAQSQSAIDSYHKSPILGMFPFIQSCDESRFDQFALRTRGKKATLAVAGREQETLGE